jgi:hypothetical protein
VNKELSLGVSKKSVRLMPPVVLGSQSPIDMGKDRLIIEADCTKYAAAYSSSPSVRVISKWQCGLYAFGTFSHKKCLSFDKIREKQPLAFPVALDGPVSIRKPTSIMKAMGLVAVCLLGTRLLRVCSSSP